MTKANEFMRALQAGGTGVQSVDEAWSRQREAWLADLESLRTSIKLWLKPVVQAGLASVSDAEFSLSEPDLGAYSAPGLTMDIVVGRTPQTVVLKPRGMRIHGVVATGGARAIGARGRVDLECGLAREILLRFKDDGATNWLSFFAGEKAHLDEEVFFELLGRVVGVKLK